MKPLRRRRNWKYAGYISRPLTGGGVFLPIFHPKLDHLSGLCGAGFLLSYNHRRARKLGGKAAMPTGISAPSYSFGGMDMYAVDRLVAAGLPGGIAWEVAYWLAHYGNESDVERYICEFYGGQRERVTDG